jgi:hypothetical protein
MDLPLLRRKYVVKRLTASSSATKHTQSAAIALRASASVLGTIQFSSNRLARQPFSQLETHRRLLDQPILHRQLSYLPGHSTIQLRHLIAQLRQPPILPAASRSLLAVLYLPWTRFWAMVKDCLCQLSMQLIHTSDMCNNMAATAQHLCRPNPPLGPSSVCLCISQMGLWRQIGIGSGQDGAFRVT